MLSTQITIRPRYGEVDRMGYVYHANYVSYCHQARNELLRSLGIDDATLEQNNIMLPVIRMNLHYLNPARYDEQLTIKASIIELPKTRFQFEFEIKNETGKLICTASSTVVFVDSTTRKPMRSPQIVTAALKNKMPDTTNENHDPN